MRVACGPRSAIKAEETPGPLTAAADISAVSHESSGSGATSGDTSSDAMSPAEVSTSHSQGDLGRWRRPAVKCPVSMISSSSESPMTTEASGLSTSNLDSTLSSPLNAEDATENIANVSVDLGVAERKKSSRVREQGSAEGLRRTRRRVA